MRKLIGSVVLAAALVTLPAVAAAQMEHGAAKHEFGVDLGFVYVSPDQGDGAFTIGTPVDVRVGFVTGGKLMVEPRVSFDYISDVGGDALYTFDLGLNLLMALGQGGHRNGPYFTVGSAVNLVGLGGQSANQFSINGGIGTRSGYGSGAFRPEAFVSYAFEGDFLSVISFGLRLGLSLWH